MSNSRTVIVAFCCLLTPSLVTVDAPAAKPLQRSSRPMLSQSDDCSEVSAWVSSWAAQQAVSQSYAFRPRYHHRRRPALGFEGAPSKMSARGKSSEARPMARAPAADMAAPIEAASGRKSPSSYTKTNVQEVGVDEADVVKTDGGYIYVAQEGNVLIFESWPADKTQMIAKLPLPDNAQPTQLFVRGEMLLVLSSINQAWRNNSGHAQGTRITYVDITDRAQPSIERHVDLQGALLQSRRIGDDLYLVANGGLQNAGFLIYRGKKFIEEQGRRTQRQQNTQTVQQVANFLQKGLTKSELNRILPRSRSRRIGGKFRALLSCSDLYVPKSQAQMGALTVTHLRLNRHEPPTTIGLLGMGQKIYASTEALYVAAGNEIHKFRLNSGSESLGPEHVASGTVPGYLLNQFSMSEHRGFLRVATTDGSGNNLFVLQESQRKLEIVGSLTGLAPGERIYAARMFGDKGYVVTFRQTDPLFTLDLSNPYKPRVVGELKINGFSSYIHPLDNDRLLTIGQDANARGRISGVHLQIFDVSNPAAPKRVHHERFSIGSQSTAQSDHHALTYDPATRTLAVPLQSHGAQPFSGLVVYQIDPNDGFKTLGRVSHSDRLAEYWRQKCKSPRQSNNNACSNVARKRFARSRQSVPMRRSIVMENYLFSLSQIALEVNDLREMGETIAAVVLSAEPNNNERPAVQQLSALTYSK